MRRIVVLAMVMAILGMASVQGALLEPGNHLDPMTTATTRSMWHEWSTATTAGFGYHNVYPNDPRTTGTALTSTVGPNNYWFTYKAEAGKYFQYADFSYCAGWSGGAGNVTLSYRIGDGDWVASSTTTSTNVGASGPSSSGWVGRVRTYDFAGRDIKPTEIKIVMSSWGNSWNPYVGSVYMEVVPEPATLMLLGLGSFLSLRRRK